MFFIIRGECKILLDDAAKTEVSRKRQNQYFGEICMFYPDKPRTAWVVADTYCVLARLTKRAFDSIFSELPTVRQMMLDQIEGFKNVKVAPQTAQRRRKEPPKEEESSLFRKVLGLPGSRRTSVAPVERCDSAEGSVRGKGRGRNDPRNSSWSSSSLEAPGPLPGAQKAELAVQREVQAWTSKMPRRGSFMPASPETLTRALEPLRDGGAPGSPRASPSLAAARSQCRGDSGGGRIPAREMGCDAVGDPPAAWVRVVRDEVLAGLQPRLDDMQEELMAAIQNRPRNLRRNSGLKMGRGLPKLKDPLGIVVTAAVDLPGSPPTDGPPSGLRDSMPSSSSSSSAAQEELPGGVP